MEIAKRCDYFFKHGCCVSDGKGRKVFAHNNVQWHAETRALMKYKKLARHDLMRGKRLKIRIVVVRLSGDEKVCKELKTM